MTEFFMDYGLFTAKVITVILIILLGAIAFALAVSTRQRPREAIEIDKINEKFDNMRDVFEAQILSKDEVKHLAKERKKEAKAEEKKRKQALKSEGKEPAKPRLFVLNFNGDMHASAVDHLREAVTALLTFIKPPNQNDTNNEVRDEILVNLESPGGLVHSYGLAASQLKRIRDRKIPLTVAVDLVAASGGYLMAAMANKIIAAPFAVVGSIGVLAQVPNINRLLEKHDIDIEQHTAGEYKTTLTLLGKNTDKARKKFKEELEDTHVLFKEFVSKQRPQLDIDKLATGEHWYGEQAIDLKLIDEIITSDDYLLNKSKDTDIFEVTYIINETLSEKLSSFLNDVTESLYLKLQSFFKKSSF